MILPRRQQGKISSDKGLYQNTTHIKAPFPSHGVTSQMFPSKWLA